LKTKKESKQKKMAVKYSVVSKVGYFRRSGILFSKTPTVLQENEITEEIKKEPMLEVTKLKE